MSYDSLQKIVPIMMSFVGVGFIASIVIGAGTFFFGPKKLYERVQQKEIKTLVNDLKGKNNLSEIDLSNIHYLTEESKTKAILLAKQHIDQKNNEIEKNKVDLSEVALDLADDFAKEGALEDVQESINSLPKVRFHKENEAEELFATPELIQALNNQEKSSILTVVFDEEEDGLKNEELFNKNGTPAYLTKSSKNISALPNVQLGDAEEILHPFFE